MSNVFLAPANCAPTDYISYPEVRIRESAAIDLYGEHSLCTDPLSADLILFATNYRFPPIGLGILRNPVFWNHSERCVLFDSGDYPSPLIGGLCASWSSRLERISGLGLGWCYHHPTFAEPLINSMTWVDPLRYTWSFIGSSWTHPIRKTLLGLNDTKSLALDTGTITMANLRGEISHQQYADFLSQYLVFLRDSAFIVCPRGIGTSSMRIFEAMRAGRAPVIISDQWSPPPFVNWEKCSLRIPEEMISEVPTYLHQKLKEAEMLGHNARTEWERVFGRQTLFHHTVEAGLMLIRQRSTINFLKRLGKYQVFLESQYTKELWRYMRQMLFS